MSCRSTSRCWPSLLLGTILGLGLLSAFPARLTAGDNKDLKELVEQLRRKLEQKDQETKTLNEQLRNALLIQQTQQVVISLLQKEVKTVKQVLEARDKNSLKTEADRAAIFQKMQQALNERDAALARTDNLLNRVRELERELAKAKGDKAIPRGAQPNPPAVNVKGVVTKVDKGMRDLVLISIGSDVGLQVGHSLEVYRLQPPEYLGTIRIVEVTPNSAVGRHVRSDNFKAAPVLRPGDHVASKIVPGP